MSDWKAFTTTTPNARYTTRHLTQLLTTTALRAAPRRAWLTLLCVLAVALTLTAAGLFGRYVRQTLAEAQPITIIATPTPPQPPLQGGRAGVVPTAIPPAPLPALYDYRRPETAITIDGNRIACVVGVAEAGAWQLVALDTCDLSAPRLWLAAGLLPDSVPIASDADLTPRTAVPAPPVASEPAIGVSRAQQAPEPADTTHERPTAPDDTGPATTPLPPIYDLSAAREYTTWHPPMVYPGDGCGGPDVAPPACHAVAP